MTPAKFALQAGVNPGLQGSGTLVLGGPISTGKVTIDVLPREFDILPASKTGRGRKILFVWLKHLENHSRRAEDRNDPMATYDFTWLWRELKVEHLRH